MELSCCICQNILKDPVECVSCQTNICSEHLKNIKRCPNCRKSPFNYNKNLGIIKILELRTKEILNKQIKQDPEIIQCILCPYEGTKWNFCYHFAEEHKIEILKTFSKKKLNNESIRSDNLKNSSLVLDDFENSIELNINENNDIKPLNEQNEYSNIKKSESNNIHKHHKSDMNEDVFKINFLKQNSGEVKPLLSQRIDNFNNEINSGIKPFSKSKIEVSKNELYYCGKRNELINCNCCIPEHICKKGNCLCVNCMKYNIKKFGLENKELINKAGRICFLDNGVYHCGNKFKVIIENAIGVKRTSSQYCRKNYFCDECKILNNFKEEYFKYVY